MINQKNLIWLDLEMTGLDPDHHHILEITTLVTDNNLNILSDGPSLAIYQPDNILNLMDNWNVITHSKNGLINRVKLSQHTIRSAEIETIKFIKKWVPEKKSPICGNSISHDRRFLFKHMPELESYFHYRCIDVSTLKELLKRWNPSIASYIKKNNNHRSKEDIQSSVAELIFYKKNFLKF